MTAPLRITVGSDSLTANSRVEQVAIVVEDGRQKETLLLAHLRDNGFSLNAAKKKGAGEGKDRDKALVFALYKKEATRLFEFLQRKGYEVGCINGDMSQDKRTQSLNDFKTGKVNILVATGASLFFAPSSLCKVADGHCPGTLSFQMSPLVVSTFRRSSSSSTKPSLSPLKTCVSPVPLIRFP